MRSTLFASWFNQVTGFSPHDWQIALANEPALQNRLVHIPTGFGKTLGVASVWAFHRREGNDWPRRLIWCLPSRVLVEQTVDSLMQLLEKVSQVENTESVPVYPLLGGVDTGDWYRYPEKPCVLVGTQDMLLSRALNRGYGSGRARWPIEFGLLNRDCLWVMDEVQLQGVGLATSVQLQAFRALWESQIGSQCATWWMSATLTSDWLKTKDFADSVPALCEHAIDLPEADRQGELWKASKPCSVEVIAGKPDKAKKQWAELILQRHRAQDAASRMTLVIVNRVESAIEIHDSLSKLIAKQDDTLELHLVHSRFRGRERQAWPEACLSRNASTADDVNRIIVATQVVEAGVDISATTLITELAPWGSLVQRFGRAARYGGTANVVVVDPQLKAKDSLPYEENDLSAAAEAISKASDVSLAELSELEGNLKQDTPELYQRLYRFEYCHLLSQRDCEELFDTTPDLSGADLDIGRFIREEGNRDVSVCWSAVDWNEQEEKLPSPAHQPVRDALCPVPIAQARDWLISKKKKWPQWSNRSHAWCWDYVEGSWKRLVSDRQLLPGSVVLVDVQYGGYDPQRGFTGDKPGKSINVDVSNVFERPRKAEDDLADQGQSREDRSHTSMLQTIATHGWMVSQEIEKVADSLGLPITLKSLLMMAARWHDWGKAHGAFQANIRREEAGVDCWELAKARDWVDYRHKHFNWPEKLNWPGPPMGKRRGFRHELATTLGMLELLSCDQPEHDALLGPFAELIELGEIARCQRDSGSENHPLVGELRALSADDFHLLLYLVCSHHGKVRGGWQSTPLDQDFPFENGSLTGTGMPICGIRDGDPLSGVQLYDTEGQCHVLPSVVLHLDVSQLGISARYGVSWTERVQRVRQTWGIFTLAWLEAIVRAADGRASQDSANTDPDPLLATMQETNG
ncbi:hypothetical protein C5Y96_23710 [Blastopirellula marina]|uniref:Uncharacterized protein n=1 Tax=Blastopirellula marina TaxID=124 RepID=A0A2S8F0X7_9BACT|nr:MULTISPECIES: DEAD/DEAH box helicase [Pirellulaceae]PQO25816.1 hypothetical protein C5Y96_23710 [Blastopirellula marina]RCS43499.1 hypothetical protein DTL36_23760 [Bremerella cremea]